jgi:hypothetical protein
LEETKNMQFHPHILYLATKYSKQIHYLFIAFCLLHPPQNQDRYSKLSVKIMREKKLPCTEPLPEEKLEQRSKQDPSL